VSAFDHLFPELLCTGKACNQDAGEGQKQGDDPGINGITGLGVGFVGGCGNFEAAFRGSVLKFQGDGVFAQIQSLQQLTVQGYDGAAFFDGVVLAVDGLAVDQKAVKIPGGTVSGEAQGFAAVLVPGGAVAFGDPVGNGLGLFRLGFLRLGFFRLRCIGSGFSGLGLGRQDGEVDGDRAGEYDFDTKCMTGGDFVLIESKEGVSDGNIVYGKYDNYNIYYFDTDSNILYYFHNNI
jgi:hypothetical protein